MNPMVLIALANAAVDIGVKLINASKSLPDADSPEALAELKKLEERLNVTLAEVKAYHPKQV